MSFNVVYAAKDKINNKIAQGIILPESLIITNEQPDNAEVFYYDEKGILKQLIKRTKFDSEMEARVWIAKYDYSGENISIKDANGNWNSFTVSVNNELIEIPSEENLSSLLDNVVLNGGTAISLV